MLRTKFLMVWLMLGASPALATPLSLWQAVSIADEAPTVLNKAATLQQKEREVSDLRTFSTSLQGATSSTGSFDGDAKSDGSVGYSLRFEGAKVFELSKSKAELELQEARLALQNARFEVQSEAFNAWHDLLDAQEALKVAEAERSLSALQLERARARFEGGLISQADLQNTQLADKNAEQSVQSAALQLQIARGALALLGLPADAVATLPSKQTALLPIADGLAVEPSLAMKQAELQLQRAHLALSGAREVRPLQLRGQGGVQYGHFSLNGDINEQLSGGLTANMHLRAAEGWNVALNANVPLQRSNVALLNAQDAVKEANEALLRLRVREANNASLWPLRLVEARKSIQMAEEALAIATQHEAAIRARLEGGVAGPIDLQNATLARVRAERTLVGSYKQHNLLALQQWRALGRLLPQDGATTQ